MPDFDLIQPGRVLGRVVKDDLVRALAPRYAHVGKPEKGQKLGGRAKAGRLRPTGTAGPSGPRADPRSRRDYVNFLHPVRKLVSKTRDGARVRGRYDAATTPFRRLVDSGVLSIQMTRELKARSANVDPIRRKVHLEAAQRTLAAARSDSYVRQS